MYYESLLPNQRQLIFDCGFDEIMTLRENLETARQLMDCIGKNRMHRSPFSLQLSNINAQASFPQQQKLCYNAWILCNTDAESECSLNSVYFCDLFETG